MHPYYYAKEFYSADMQSYIQRSATHNDKWVVIYQGVFQGAKDTRKLARKFMHLVKSLTNNLNVLS